MNTTPPSPGAKPPPVSGIILAGGRARRFGALDKGLIELAGRPLVAWVEERLRPQVAEILLSANRNLDRYAALGHTVVPDSLPQYPGPLAGILAAAQAGRQAWLLSVPCDVPFLPLDLVPRLHAKAEQTQVPLVRAADATDIHYAIMLLHRDLIPDLRRYVAEGGCQVQAWQARHPCGTLLFETAPHAFLNINSEQDLGVAEQVISQSVHGLQ